MGSGFFDIPPRSLVNVAKWGLGNFLKIVSRMLPETIANYLPSSVKRCSKGLEAVNRHLGLANGPTIPETDVGVTSFDFLKVDLPFTDLGGYD